MATKKKSKKAKKSKRPSGKKAAAKRGSSRKLASKKRVVAKRSSASTRKIRKRSSGSNRKTLSKPTAQSGDFQGIRDVATADSESVAELLEEGNAFEADAVAGVEHADENEGREVHTHEVPEDDVPEEYLDKD